MGQIIFKIEKQFTQRKDLNFVLEKGENTTQV